MSAPTPADHRRVLAVDGGQSTIRLLHSAGPRTEAPGVSRQEGDVVQAVAAAIESAWRAAGSPRTERVVLGLTTAPAEPHDQVRLCAAVAAATAAAEVWLADDAVTTHAGALAGGWGVSVTAGTGVACLAVPAGDDAPARIIGGHGYLLGDEGGAFWIGRAALGAVLRAADGRGPAVPGLAAAAAARFDGLADLSARIHALPRPVNAVAHLAPDVLALAAAGDTGALQVGRDAVDELVILVKAGIAAAPPAGGTTPVALGGRLLERATWLRATLDRAIRARVPAADVRDAAGSPLDGALALGMGEDPGRYRALVVRWRRTG